jgi:protein-tyrosine-phosphatase
MIKAMHEKGIDMAYRVPQRIESAISNTPPDFIVTMGCGEECPLVPGAQIRDWDMPDPAGKPPDFMRQVRDEIESNVKNLIKELT